MNSYAELDTYQLTVRALSDRIVEAQAPIRVLDAIKWDTSIREQFLAHKGKQLPAVDRGYYQGKPLAFDAAAKKLELQNIERDITRQLGQFSPVGQIMRRMCREYRMVVRMLEARGTEDFGLISQELYGAASDAFNSDDQVQAEYELRLSDVLENIEAISHVQSDEKKYDSREAVILLQDRLVKAFGGDLNKVRVFESDEILADAAAGVDYIKIRRGAFFSERDIKVLEVHEGLVHVATTLNGHNQNVCTFLSKNSPSSTMTQEGLAILMEVVTGASSGERLKKLASRVRAIYMAEQGADFLGVFDFYQAQGFSFDQSYNGASRVFRGGCSEGLPFTKDLSYLKGLVEVSNYVLTAFSLGRFRQIPLLFCGKTTVGDMPIIDQLCRDGVVVSPQFVPEHFFDLKELSISINSSFVDFFR